MRDIACSAFLRSVALSSSTVLLHGMEGTGRKHLARKIHAMSMHGDLPFTVIKCNVAPHAYVGVKGNGECALEWMRGVAARLVGVRPGTLFFDEIGESPPAFQRIILGMLRCRSDASTGCGAGCALRIIASTSKDLRDLSRAGRFREDLYYRLNVVKIDLPPLCLRKIEIAGIVENLLADFNANHGKAVAAVTREAMARILAYDWPGNITELKRVIERSAMLCHGAIIDVEHLPDRVHEAPERCADLHLSDIDRIQYHIIASAVKRYPRNHDAVAREVGMSKAALLRRMEYWDMERRK